MLTIRRGVFETNSSSSHSLCIVAMGRDIQTNEYLPVQDGVLRLQPDEFGWGPSIHYDAWTKARYCLIWIMQYSDSRVSHFLMLRDALLRGCPSIKKFIFGGLRFHPDRPFEGLPSEESNLFIVALDENDSDYWSGYIDHQSDDVGASAFQSDAALYSFIFNTLSVLVIDNDNH